jgi:hypothetical protein
VLGPSDYSLAKQKKPRKSAVPPQPVPECITMQIVSLAKDEDIKPSRLLSDVVWTYRICRLLGISCSVQSISDTNEMKEKADVLVKLLRGRMKSLMKRRIE